MFESRKGGKISSFFGDSQEIYGCSWQRQTFALRLLPVCHETAVEFLRKLVSHSITEREKRHTKHGQSFTYSTLSAGTWELFFKFNQSEFAFRLLLGLVSVYNRPLMLNSCIMGRYNRSRNTSLSTGNQVLDLSIRNTFAEEDLAEQTEMCIV